MKLTQIILPVPPNFPGRVRELILLKIRWNYEKHTHGEISDTFIKGAPYPLREYRAL